MLFSWADDVAINEELNEMTRQLDATEEKEVADKVLGQIVEEYESGVHGNEFVPDDAADPLQDFCEYCSMYDGAPTDHDIDECAELRALEESQEAGLKRLDDEWWESQVAYTTEPAAMKDNQPEPEYHEDENSVVIPTDPYAPCYNRAGIKFICLCTPEERVECAKCEVGREWADHAWRPWREDGEYNVSKRSKNKQKREQKKKAYQPSQKAKDDTKPKGLTTTGGVTGGGVQGKIASNPAVQAKAGTTPPAKTSTAPKSNYSAGYSSGGDWGGYAGKDRHYGDTYTTYDGKLTFYVSSMWNNRKENEFVPDWGLYFDWGWHPWWRAEHIDWRDYGVPENFNIAFEQLLVAIEKCLDGKKVEMGCIGAHGRTGTALAAINVMLGCDPKEAIDHVRKHHCEHAIESTRQEWWVHWVAAAVNGTEAPPEPKYTPKTTTTTTTTAAASTVACTKRGHFEMWLWQPAGKDLCCASKGKSCSYWEEDYDEFCQGKFPKWHEKNYASGDYANSVVIDGFIVPKPTWAKGGIGGSHLPNAKKGCVCDVCRYREAGFEAFLCPALAPEKTKWTTKMNDIENKVMEKLGVQKAARIAIECAEKEGWDPHRPGTHAVMAKIHTPPPPLVPPMKPVTSTTAPVGPSEALEAFVGPLAPTRTIKSPHPATRTQPDKAEALVNRVLGEPIVETIKIAQPDGTIMEIVVHEDYKKTHKVPSESDKPALGTRKDEFVYTNQGWVSEILAPVIVGE